MKLPEIIALKKKYKVCKAKYCRNHMKWNSTIDGSCELTCPSRHIFIWMKHTALEPLVQQEGAWLSTGGVTQMM